MNTVLTINHKDYTCRLSARVSIELEDKLGKNPLSIFISGMPKISDVLLVFAKSAGISEEEAYDAYDDYIAEGHTMSEFIQEIVKVFENSGYYKTEKN